MARTAPRKLLVLDINGVLLASCFRGNNQPANRRPNRQAGHFAIFERPHCREFVEFCLRNFVVGVWSSAKMHNLAALVQHIFGGAVSQLAFVWDQAWCTQTELIHPLKKGKPVFLKELSKLWDDATSTLPWEKGQFGPSNTILVDDAPYKAIRNPAYTAVFPATYTALQDDDDLLAEAGGLCKYLTCLLRAPDVRIHIEAHPFGQPPLTSADQLWGHIVRHLAARKEDGYGNVSSPVSALDWTESPRIKRQKVLENDRLLEADDGHEAPKFWDTESRDISIMTRTKKSKWSKEKKQAAKVLREESALTELVLDGQGYGPDTLRLDLIEGVRLGTKAKLQDQVGGGQAPCVPNGGEQQVSRNGRICVKEDGSDLCLGIGSEAVRRGQSCTLEEVCTFAGRMGEDPSEDFAALGYTLGGHSSGVSDEEQQNRRVAASSSGDRSDSRKLDRLRPPFAAVSRSSVSSQQSINLQGSSGIYSFIDDCVLSYVCTDLAYPTFLPACWSLEQRQRMKTLHCDRGQGLKMGPITYSCTDDVNPQFTPRVYSQEDE